VTRNNGFIDVMVESPELAEDINIVLVGAGCRVRGIREKMPTLEDAFLKVTGRKQRGGLSMAAQEQLSDMLIIASKEFRDYIKSKRFVLVGILYAVMALAILGITIMSLSYMKSMGLTSDFMPSQVLGTMDYLNIILVLLAVIITADTISAERKDRTIYQLLSKPVDRSTVVMGKFLGCLGVVSFFYAAGLSSHMPSPPLWRASSRPAPTC